MATKEQIKELTDLFAKARPMQRDSMQYNTSDSESTGMLGVLIYLYRADETVTAGMISQVMHVTTGRVTVLIQKMSEKGLVIRRKSQKDARVTEIRITEKGRQIVEDMEHQRTAQMEQLIDTIGMDRLKEYIRTSQEVWKILTPLKLDI